MMSTSLLRLIRSLCVLLFFAVAAGARADVELPPIISDHMVLQRDVAAPIWGTAAPAEAVSVSIAGQTKSTTANAEGRWKVTLDPLASGEGLTLTVQARNAITVTDVLVGEVWLGSGQSNMAGPVRTFKGNDEGLQKIHAGAPYPRIRLLKSDSTGWQVATSANVDGFPAVMFAFGLRLQNELDVPVGLVVGAVGGSPSGYWLTEDMLRKDVDCQAQITEFAATYDYDAAVRNYERLLAAWKKKEVEAKQQGTPVGRAPAEPARAGQSAGEIGSLFERHLRPFVPYAVRGVLWDQGESGTGITGLDQSHVMGALIRGWREAWDRDFPFLYMQKPSGGGTAWNLEDPTTMNASPFVAQPEKLPGQNEGIARETHNRIQQYPKTVMIVTTDLGGGTHPSNKSGYAARAVRTAQGYVYGKDVEFSGPLYAAHAIEGNKVRVQFKHVGRGLAARHTDRLQGFLIAGADKKFHWAEAVIDGDAVIVSSPQVTIPAAVRYAWSSAAPWANLFNQDGLPAQTFRTDDWK